MKLTERLYHQTVHLWDAAADKPFVRQMADGTLKRELFVSYMLQDFLYLKDYIGILRVAQERTGDAGLIAFLDRLISDTEHETNTVQLPNLKEIGIRDEEIRKCKRLPVITEYVKYMRDRLDEHGIRAGLTALLQCSWVYAYIGQVSVKRYGSRLALSPYSSWFHAYTDTAYTESNAAWIRFTDALCADITEEETQLLCEIFKTCAGYENRLWDSLYRA